MPAWPEVLGNGAVGREETLRMPGGCAPLHVVLALPRRTMGVLTPVIQIATLAVFDPDGVTGIKQAVNRCDQWTSVRELTDQLRRYGRS